MTEQIKQISVKLDDFDMLIYKELEHYNSSWIRGLAKKYQVPIRDIYERLAKLEELDLALGKIYSKSCMRKLTTRK
jgi:hypothetical protein